MSKSIVKPTFGRTMDPCKGTMIWANKLKRNEVVAIKAETTKVISRDDGPVIE